MLSQRAQRWIVEQVGARGTPFPGMSQLSAPPQAKRPRPSSPSPLWGG